MGGEAGGVAGVIGNDAGTAGVIAATAGIVWVERHLARQDAEHDDHERIHHGKAGERFEQAVQRSEELIHRLQ